MKQITQFFILFVISLQAAAQVDESKPFSLDNVVYNIEATQLVIGDSLDITALLEEDLVRATNFPRAGILQDVALNLSNSGTWFDLVNGDKLWRLKLKVPNALAVSAYFDSFFIPEGGVLHAFSPSYDEILASFTVENNSETGFYVTDYVHGEVIVLEYYEPKEVRGLADISIHGLNGFYTMIQPLRDNSDTETDRSGTCQVDVNCPEGDDWKRQRDGVVRITVLSNGNTGFCSGSLVNNTAEDCTPLILSAHHCATDDNDINATTSDFAQWVFRFNYQQKNCTSQLVIGSYNKTGCVKLANSTNNGGILGSDYLLVELTEDLDESRTPYFNGWDASGSAGNTGVGIHHPGGDIKKINTYDQTVTSSNWSTSPAGSHWRVKWIGTVSGHGVSEGGSSGSPIFNESGLIIGQLSGGLSECNDVTPNGQTLPDLYGKMSYNWTGASNVQLIGPYLDPVGNGSTKVMQGNYYLCSQGNGVVNSIQEQNVLSEVKVFPNPVKNEITIRTEQVENLDVTIYNQVGKEVVRFKNYRVNEPINVSYLTAGIYFVRLGINGVYKTSKVVKL